MNESDRVAGDLLEVTMALVRRGARVIMVGCTELSMCLEALRPAGVPLIDPLRIVARHLVETGLERRGTAHPST